MVASPGPGGLGRFERAWEGKGGGVAKIAILDDAPEVVTLLSRFLTQREDLFMGRVGETPRVMAQLTAFQPDLLLIPLYRAPERLALPLEDLYRDVPGARMLETLARTPALADVPLLVFSFSVRPEELPSDFRARIRYDAFLLFPEGLQELNPLISGFLGPAPRPARPGRPDA